MAKQAAGPIVRHIEKGILALTAGVFLFFVATFGVVSPNTVTINSEEVGPGEVDRELKVAADSVVQKLQQHKPEPTVVTSPKKRVENAEDPLLAADVPAEIPRAVAFQPAVKEVGVAEVGDVSVPEVVPFERPVILATGRSGITLSTPETLDENGAGSSARARSQGSATNATDVNWVTVYAFFDRQEQEGRAKAANYSTGLISIVFLGADVQRREMRPDGSYTDWVDVSLAAPRVAPPTPEVEVFESSGQLTVSEQDTKAVEDFANLINKDGNQLNLMRPLFPPVLYGNEWHYPRLEDWAGESIDLLSMDAEYQTSPDCRYEECVGLSADTLNNLDNDTLIEDANAAIEQENLDRAQRIVAELEKRSGDGNVGGGMGGGMGGGDKALSVGQKRDLRELKEKVVKLEQDLTARRLAASGTRLPAQVLWAHDANPGSLVSGRTYEYRMRPRILHRYAARPFLLEDDLARKAADVVLVGPWSEPSDPVTIPEDTRFFVRRSRERQGEVSVEVFKWVKGAWIDESFKVKIGDLIGSVRSVKDPSNATGGSIQVDFGTGGRVVDIDFNYPLLQIRSGRSVQPQEETTTSLTYIDGNGRLRERLEMVDGNDPLYEEMKAKTE